MHDHAFHASHAFTRAHKAAARHARRGNLALADKWLKIAERHERLMHRLHVLEREGAELATDREKERALRRMIRKGELVPESWREREK
jgi:hypothetical protein